VSKSVLHPRELGLQSATLEQLSVSSVEEAAAVIRGVLAGEAGPRRDIALLNAAAALLVAGAAESMQDSLGMAAEAVDSGRAAETLETLKRVSADA
ncbi:MAG: anthranilate phosphoribosyltransferase, partial [Salinibacterium sp.]|nr:anthranilate phosphoribosyltransferase [Salinibacterium sp.]